MAIGEGLLTLSDYAKRAGKQFGDIVDVMKQTNEMLEDMVFVEANNGTVHKSILRTELPQGSWRKLNAGVGTSKSRTVEVVDHCSMLEVYSKVDAALVDLGKSAERKAEILWDEEQAFLQGLTQQHQTAVVYGANPEEVVGLDARYNALSNKEWFKKYILNAGGTTANSSSIWLVGWGKNTVCGIFPDGTQAGIKVTDKSVQTVKDADGKEFEAYVKHYSLKTGLSIRNPKCVVRICNVDMKNLAGMKLIDLMSEALETIEQTGVQRLAFYMRRDVRTALRKELRDKNNVHLSLDEAAGKQVLKFDGTPVRRVDALLATEKALSL